MTPDEFVVAARELIAHAEGVAFRARPGGRTLRRYKHMTVVCVDLAQHDESDMREGLERA